MSSTPPFIHACPAPIPRPSLAHPAPIPRPSRAHPAPIPHPSRSTPAPIPLEADWVELPSKRWSAVSSQLVGGVGHTAQLALAEPPPAEWLLGAFAVVSSVPSLLQRCFPLGLLPDQGVLAVRLCRFGRWTHVLTDDTLPAMSGRLLFLGSPANQHLIWALLLKARQHTPLPSPHSPRRPHSRSRT